MGNAVEFIVGEAERQTDGLLCLQREIHRYPELGYEEVRTAGRVAQEMADLGLAVRTGVVHTGVVADLVGGRPGETVALRADMDAFPIDEADGLEWRSQRPGAAHVCGHDAHTSIAVGVARVLAGIRDQLPGRVRFIFQPAEERPLVEGEDDRPYWEGVRATPAAEMMVREGVLGDPPVSAVYGLHLWPWLPAGHIGIEDGAAMAGAANFRARVHGRGAHGAAPHSGVDSIVTVAQILNMLQVIVARQTSPGEPLVITVGTIRGGDRRNVIADRVEITGTVRGLSRTLLAETVPARMHAIFAGVTAAMEATYELEYEPLIMPVMNDAALVASARGAVAAALGQEAVAASLDRGMTSEDFACFSERVPALYFKIGCSEPGGPIVPLHNRAFTFAAGAITTGVAAVSAAIAARLAGQ